MEFIAFITPIFLLAFMAVVNAICFSTKTGKMRRETTSPNPVTTIVGKGFSGVRWFKLVTAFVALILFSFLLAYWFNMLADRLHLPINQYAFIAYLVVFLVSLIANLTVMAPVPIAVSIMITVAQSWNPLLSALAAALGGSLGELSGYYAGYAGRKMAISNDFFDFNRVGGWINRWGAWAIVFLAFQPIIPFDVGGLIAGAAKMPIRKFLPALFAGKLPKYILLAYAGIGLINFLPKSWFS
jgi:membrane protein YqaA with SNARE-associated domain